MNSLFSRGKKILTGPQENLFYAASIIMIMIVVSRVLGLLRNTILLSKFTASEVSLFLSAFRLPDTVFEMLVFGTFSSAFIPVFSKLIKKDTKEAWMTASIVVNIGLVSFLVIAIILGIFAGQFYQFVTPGYALHEREVVVSLTRILLFAQAFFVVSYVLTGVLESLKHFAIPALAPILYNLGIIAGAYFLTPIYGLQAPAYGAVIGACLHFLIQLPLARRLGFRFTTIFAMTASVKDIAKLAIPRIVETGFLQISRITELALSSLISTASYAYFYLGNALQAVPVGLFGLSIAKAALPTLSEQADDPKRFAKTFTRLINQVVFLTLPFVAILIILRIPIVRLLYGRELFDWNSTLQTGLVVSAFAFGIVFQSVVALMNRGFYALYDTKTPVKISIITTLGIAALDMILVLGFKIQVWALGASYSFGVAIQSIILYKLLAKKNGYLRMGEFKSSAQSFFCAFFAGLCMYILMKLFDRSVWVRRLSFVEETDLVQNLAFDLFVLDTRYTVNLLVLTIVVSMIGCGVYVLLAFLMRIPELFDLFEYMKRLSGITARQKATETVATTNLPQQDTTQP